MPENRLLVRSILYIILFCISFSAFGKEADSIIVLKQLVSTLRNINDIDYHYAIEANFPNGDKDTLSGKIYFSTGENVYYNECYAFTMIYSKKWFYKADHRKKTITILNLEKDVDKKTRKEVEKQIFQEKALNTFLDSVVLKSGYIKSDRYEKSARAIRLTFPNGSITRQMDIVYDTSDNMPLSCEMKIVQPYPTKHSKNIQPITERIKLYHFKKEFDRDEYKINNFFTCDKSRIELRKFKNYRLIHTK